MKFKVIDQTIYKEQTYKANFKYEHLAVLKCQTKLNTVYCRQIQIL